MIIYITPWLIKPGGSMPHSQGPSNNPYPESNQPNSSSRSILILSSYLCLGLPKGVFPVGLPVNIFKALLPSSILATCPDHLKLRSSSSWSLLHSPFSFLLGPNIRLRILFHLLTILKHSYLPPFWLHALPISIF